jgi:hypothetical protein
MAGLCLGFILLPSHEAAFPPNSAVLRATVRLPVFFDGKTIVKPMCKDDVALSVCFLSASFS